MNRSGIVRSWLLALIMALAGPISLAAQVGPGAGGPPTALTGMVQDAETGGPLAAAAVSVFSPADSSLVTGALTNENGRFLVTGLRPGRYYVRVSYLGYGNRTVDEIALTPSAPRKDLGVIGLSAEAVQVEGLVVEGEKSPVQIQVDRTVYNTEKMPSSAGGTATDVLRNVPSVQVDIDGNVSLRGNSNVAIQINGRPVPMRGDALAGFLNQLPSAMVEKVEVIPNPSAKQDPEGMGGILNIVLKQNADLGLSGGVTLGASTNDRYNGSGNLGYQSGPWTLMGSYGYSTDERGSDGSTFRTNLFANPVTYYDEQTIGSFDNSGHNVNLSADYKLTDKNTLTSNFVFSKRGGGFDNTNEFTYLDASRDTTDTFDQLSAIERDDRTVDAALGFRHVVKQARDELTGEVRFDRTSSSTDSRYHTIPGTSSSTDEALNMNDQDEGRDEWTAQLDWTKPLGESMKLETGYKGTIRDLNSDFLERDFSNGSSTPDATRRNTFDYSEDVNALYGLLSRTAGRLQLQGGVRAERTNTQFDLTTTGESFDNAYWSWFPSASALYNLEEDQSKSLRLSYSRRIQRPNTRFLNPFPLSEDPLNRFVGNPELGPEYTNAYELTYSMMGQLGTLQLTPFYRHTTDVIRRYKTVDTTGVSTTTFENLDKSDSYGADLNGSFRLGPVNGFAGVSVYQQETSGETLQSGLSSQTTTWDARLSATWKITPSTEVQYFQFYRGPQDIEQGHISGFTFTNLAVRQKLWSDAASLTVRVMDPFDKMGFSFRTQDANSIQTSTRKFDSRAVYLSFNYTFGQQPRLRPRRGQDQGDQGATGGADIGIQ